MKVLNTAWNASKRPPGKTNLIHSLWLDHLVWNSGVERRNFVIVGQKVGVKQQDWKKRILAGVSATSDYSLDAGYTLQAQPLNFRHVRKHLNGLMIPDQVSDITGFGYSYNLANRGSALNTQIAHITSASAQVDNEAISRLHAKIREDTAAINGSTFLGELRETIGMLRSPFQAARKNVVHYLDAFSNTSKEVRRNVKRKRSDSDRSLSIRRAQALKDGMAGTWLEVQFGLKPAIADTKAILLGLDRIINAHDMKSRVVAKKNVPTSANVESSGLGFWYNCMNRSSTVRVQTETGIQYIAIYRRKYDGAVGLVGRALGTFGLDAWENFVPTLWEITPWSFLIDYFVNVGSLIEASTTSQAGLVTCMRTVRQLSTLTIDEMIMPYSETSPTGNIYVTGFFGGSDRAKRVMLRATLTRTKFDELPIPSLSFSVPGWDSMKWANVAALLTAGKKLNRSPF